MLWSCKKFLNVDPADKFLDKTVYSNEVSIQQVLNGIYRQMASEDLYGGNLTMTTIDVLGQYYNTATYGTSKNWSLFANYEYDDESTRKTFDAIWSKMYRTILDVNLFVQNLEATPDQVISASKRNLLLGEAYGLRAFLHFDLLRLYGPMGSLESDMPALPYMSVPTSQPAALLSAKDILVHIRSDIEKALSLLEEDPIRKFGVLSLNADFSDENFYRLRNRRFNHFAAQMLKTRVLIYLGDEAAASALAVQLLGECSVHFPWSPSLLSLPMSANPDRIFSSEVIFGIENLDLYTIQKNHFASALETDQILVNTEKMLNNIYANPNDYRLRSAWILDASSSKTYKTFFKFDEVKASNTGVRFMQPLMRIAELYYILAECAKNKESALSYLNEVRLNRGLEPLLADALLEKEIAEEYRREFWGEGQLFYFYKRRNMLKIPSGNSPTMLLDMNENHYNVPLPLSETKNR